MDYYNDEKLNEMYKKLIAPPIVFENNKCTHPNRVRYRGQTAKMHVWSHCCYYRVANEESCTCPDDCEYKVAQ